MRSFYSLRIDAFSPRDGLRIDVAISGEKFNNLILGAAPLYGFPYNLMLDFIRDTSKYNQITHVAWHELSHLSHFMTLTREIGYLNARKWWAKVVQAETSDWNDTYGEKGRDKWEYIALAEGWAFFIEKYTGEKYLNAIFWSLNSTHPNNIYNKFPYYYVKMFNDLSQLNISLKDLQSATTVNTVYEFYEKLIKLHPQKQSKIYNIIKFYW